MSEEISEARAQVHQSMPSAITQLKDLVRIPSVSWPAFDQHYVHQSAEKVADLAREIGFFDQIDVLESQIPSTSYMGNPAVVATKKAKPGFPTVLLYAHHDVQPPGDEALWDSPPFEPTLINDRLYGRGAADDKAGIIVHLTAVKLLNQLYPENGLGVVLFVEGEEEYGSPSFTQFLSDHKKLLQSDVIVVADSGNWDINTPALTSTLRGNVTFVLDIRTLDHALHSGMFGGVAPDAFLVFAQLTSTFYDQKGAVAIDGLHETILNVPEYETMRFRDEAGLLEGVRLLGEGDISEQLWLKPSLTVTGIDFTDIANASNTLVPHISARISVRTSPTQSAAQAFDAVSGHIAKHIPFGAQFEIRDVNLGEGYAVNTQSRAYQKYRAALEESWEVAPVNMGVGGSIPFISEFVADFPHAEVLVTGVEDPDSRAHSPNESLHIPSFEKGILSELLFLLNMATKNS